MKFLIVNDDGYKAEGLEIIVETIKKYGDVVVYSPYQCESAQSQKITIHKGIKVESVIVAGVDAYAVHGSTADCVRIGIFNNPDIDIVISGINHGHNMGQDIYYSSTIAGVMQAGLLGYRGVALSCDKNYQIVRNLIDEVVVEVILNNEKYNSWINVNLPSKSFDSIKGYKMTVAGERTFKNDFIINDNTYYEIDQMIDDLTSGTDSFEVSNGYVSISNLLLKRTF